MIYGSVCSGIEAATVAWHPLGWRPAFFSEVDSFPRAVLAHHFPTVPLHGDFTTIQDGEYEPIDLLVGGTPCQDFSIAGLRAGMDGDRGNLTLQFLTLARRLRPKWLVWENVPGVLSSGGGRDFGAFLGGLGELGYGWSYRTLDAQYFGVPQRRRRVFVIGCLGDWRRAAAVLFERHSLQGNPAPSREAGTGTASLSAQGVALRGREGGATAELTGPLSGALRCSGGGGDKAHVLAGTLNANGKAAGSATQQDAESGLLIPFDTTQITSPENRSNPHAGDPCHPLAAGMHPPAIAFSSKDHGADAGEIAPTLRAMGHEGSHANAGGQIAVAFGWQNSAQQGASASASASVTPTLDKSKTPAVCVTGDVTHTLKADGFDASEDGTGRGQPLTRAVGGVRRLIPRECERLQGFPDDFTLVPFRGKPAADGPRYKALGNSMAVPCMTWIGQRIQMVASSAPTKRCRHD